MSPLRITAVVFLGLVIVGAAVAIGVQVGMEKIRTDQTMVRSTKPAIPSVTEPSIAPVNDKPSPDEAPYGAEDDGPGPGFDASQILVNRQPPPATSLPVGIVFDIRDECQGRYVNADINVINQTGRIVKEGDASIRLEFDSCLELDRVVFRPWALSWMRSESNSNSFKPNIFPKAIDKIFGDGFDIPRMMPDGNQICYVSFRVKEGTPSLDRDPIFVTLYAKGEGQSGWTQVDREKVWF